MPASRQGSPDRRGPRDGDFKAGPVCGGRVLQPKEDYTVKEIAIPSSMQKTLIFVVDLSDASLMDPELKSIDDLKEDVLDAMSVSSSKKEFQVILSGYEGHERTEISDSDALKGFFERLEISADGNMMDMIGESGGSSTDDEAAMKRLYGDDPAHNNDPARKAALVDYQKHKRAAKTELVGTKEQLSALRLGSVITKMQMRKYINRLIEIQKSNLDVNFNADTVRHSLAQAEARIEQEKAKLSEQEEKYFELESSIEERVLQAIAEARVVFEQDKQKEMQKQRDDLAEKFNRERDQLLAEAERKLKECAAPLEAKIAELGTQIATQAEALKTVNDELKSSKDSLERTLKELEATKAEKQVVENKLQLLEQELGAARATKAAEEEKRQAEAAETQRKQADELAKLKEDMETLAKSLEEAYRIFDDYGIPIPGRTTQGHDARTFKWKITKFEEKVAEYARDRPCMSQEFALWGLKGLQVEWYPNGVDNSFPGWSAVKLRIPTMQSRCKVSVKWRVIFGSNLWVGPRTDEFCEQYWWCRKGVINWPNFVKTELLKQHTDEKGAITMTIDIIKASITPVDERGIALSGLPKRMPQVLATQSAAQLHSIALGGGFNSVLSKSDSEKNALQNLDIELRICGEPVDDPQLFNLIKRYVKQTHISIENNPHGISSKNAESPRYNNSPGTLRPRTSQQSMSPGHVQQRPRTQGGLAWANSPSRSPGILGSSPTQRPGTSAGLLPSMATNLNSSSSMMARGGGGGFQNHFGGANGSAQDEFLSPMHSTSTVLYSEPGAAGGMNNSAGHFPSLDNSPVRKRGGLPMSPTRSPKRH